VEYWANEAEEALKVAGHLIERALNLSHSGLAGVMGFGIPQECDLRLRQRQHIRSHEIRAAPVDIRPRSHDFGSACVSLLTIMGR